MSTISLWGGAEGNLARRTDVSDSGAGTDKVSVLFEGQPHSYNIYTYDGSDVVSTVKSNVHNLNAAVLGAGNDSFTGGNASDTVFDGSGDDRVDLGGGTDLVRVGAGNDSYMGGAGSDFVSFGFATFDGLGMAINNATGVRCDLAISTRQDFGLFGKDVISGFENIDGGDGNDIFLGDSSANALYGMSGNDKLFGRLGDDKLNGGNGNDVLSGGRGADLLQGEGGGDSIYCGGKDGAQDIVRYLGTAESDPSGAGFDIIYGFTAGGLATSDRIDLSQIDANAATALVHDKFAFHSGGGFRSAGGEIIVTQTGPDTVVLVDTDADDTAEMQLVLKGVHGLTAGDFLL